MGLELIIKNELLNITSEDEIIKDWLLNAEISETSQITYERAVKKYIEYLKNNNYETSTRNSIIEYKNYMMDNYSNGTAYIAISGIKSLYKYLEVKQINPNVARDIKLPKIIKGFKKDIMTLEQTKNLLNSLKCNTLKEMRNTVMINLFLRCGLRTCELKNINIEDIRIENGQKVLYVLGKGHQEKDQYVVLTDDMLILIDKYLTMRKNYIDKSPLFISLSNRSYGERIEDISIRTICKQYLRSSVYDSPRLTTHSFRHTAITIASSSGANLLDIKDFARHNDVNTTMIYIKNLNRLKNAPEFKIEKMLKN